MFLNFNVRRVRCVLLVFVRGVSHRGTFVFVSDSLWCWGGRTWARSRRRGGWKRWCGRSQSATDGRTDETSRPPAPLSYFSLLTRTHTNKTHTHGNTHTKENECLARSLGGEIKIKVMMTDKTFTQSLAHTHPHKHKQYCNTRQKEMKKIMHLVIVLLCNKSAHYTNAGHVWWSYFVKHTYSLYADAMSPPLWSILFSDMTFTVICHLRFKNVPDIRHFSRSTPNDLFN